MSRPLRRYALHLVERLGFKTLRKLYSELTVEDIYEWMAYDKTSNPDWVKRYDREVELERSKEMSIADKVEAFKRLFGGANSKDRNGNNRKLNSRN